MWQKVWEVQDGHQTGRWQWIRPVNFHGVQHDELYPGVWMFGDAICVPPDCRWLGKTIPNGPEVLNGDTDHS